MSQAPFMDRVRLLRETWTERRLARAFADARSEEDQLAFLGLMYGWAEGIAAEVRAAYEGELSVRLSPPPAAERPGFALEFADGFILTAALTRVTRGRVPRWSVSVRTGTPAAAAAAVGTRLRTGRWTRARLEDAVLALLAEYERAGGGGGA